MIAAEAFCTKTVTRALCAVLVCLALGVTRGHTAAAAEDAIPPLATTPMNQIIGWQVLPWLDAIFEKLLAEKTDIVIDGTKAFTDRDLFLPGKIAIGLAYLLLDTPRDDPRFARYLEGYRAIADMTVDHPNQSWGIYYYVSALNKLREAGLLDQAVSPATLAKLRKNLDFRTFVREADWTLIDLPTNYYGVAFSIARLRFRLRWEDAGASENLLDRMVQHYETFSGEFGFSDETNGEGRFDRYSVLLIGELSQRFIETGLTITPQIAKWLRTSIDVMKLRFNPQGKGFDYGRSIGPYGDTCFLEVLSAAAHFGVLNEEEKAMAYAFATRVIARYVDFWYDPHMQSVNMWEQGRATDGYRGKFRILGENLSLSHQLIYTTRIWNALGFKDKPPVGAPDFDAWLARLPKITTTWFARGEYDRLLVTYRDVRHIISLPLINGGSGQHAKNPYYPMPFSSDMLAGAPDQGFPQLLPRFTLADGSELIPVSFIRGVQTAAEGDRITVRYHQEELDRLGAKTPIKDGRLTVVTEYRIAPGEITRTDRYTPVMPLDAERITMEFASFSDEASSSGDSIAFAKGDVTHFAVTGIGECRSERVDGKPPYRSPNGPFITRVVCTTGKTRLDKPFTIAWAIRYR